MYEWPEMLKINVKLISNAKFSTASVHVKVQLDDAVGHSLDSLWRFHNDSDFGEMLINVIVTAGKF